MYNKLNTTDLLGETLKANGRPELRNKWVDADHWRPSLIVFGRIPTNYSTNDYKVTNETYSGQPDAIDDVTGEVNGSDGIFIPPKNNGDHVQFAIDIANDSAKSGSWKRSHKGSMRNGPPNPNLIQMWIDLGLKGATLGGTTDYLPWCAGFTYWCLMKSGYPIPSSANVASAKWIAQGGWQKLGYERIPKDQAQTGDLCVWKWSHINILIENNNGKFKCVGGNQTSRNGKSMYSNNPSTSDVTINNVNSSNLISPYVYRPKK